MSDWIVLNEYLKNLDPFNKNKKDKIKEIIKGKPGSKICHRCGTKTVEKSHRDDDGQWWACRNCGSRSYTDF